MNAVVGRVSLVAVPVVLAGAAAVALSQADPFGSDLVRCAVLQHFGIVCPGCGGIRAAWLILHGDVLGAIRYNALLPALVGAAVPLIVEVFVTTRITRGLARIGQLTVCLTFIHTAVVRNILEVVWT